MRFSTLFDREVLLALLELTNHQGEIDDYTDATETGS
jgi:hypothetical protein